MGLKMCLGEDLVDEIHNC
jgi:molybdopterin/thiamine biosynthesis adenylyltransferase